MTCVLNISILSISSRYHNLSSISPDQTAPYSPPSIKKCCNIYANIRINFKVERRPALKERPETLHFWYVLGILADCELGNDFRNGWQGLGGDAGVWWCSVVLACYWRSCGKLTFTDTCVCRRQEIQENVILFSYLIYSKKNSIKFAL